MVIEVLFLLVWWMRDMILWLCQRHYGFRNGTVLDIIFNLDDLGGYLSLIKNESKIGVTIWAMIKYGDVESWTNICALSIQPNVGSEPWPIWLTKNGDIVVSTVGICFRWKKQVAL